MDKLDEETTVDVVITVKFKQQTAVFSVWCGGCFSVQIYNDYIERVPLAGTPESTTNRVHIASKIYVKLFLFKKDCFIGFFCTGYVWIYCTYLIKCPVRT